MRFRFARGSRRPSVQSLEATTLPVPTSTGLPAVEGFSVNALINGRGRPGTWHVEYGATTAYGSTTDDRELPPKLGAHFDARWDEAESTAGFLAGIHRERSRVATGGPSGGPFVRYVDAGTTDNDTNHIDGIGIIHLGLYFYCGHYPPGDVAPFFLGGGFADFRGAQFSMWMRGQSWRRRRHHRHVGPGLSRAGVRRARGRAGVRRAPLRFPNWAYEGDETRTAAATSSSWALCEWSLESRTDAWTFGGCNGGRLLRLRRDRLAPVENDGRLFSGAGTPHATVRPSDRRHRLRRPPDHLSAALALVPDNGGALVSSPAGGTGGRS